MKRSPIRRALSAFVKGYSATPVRGEMIDDKAANIVVGRWQRYGETYRRYVSFQFRLVGGVIFLAGTVLMVESILGTFDPERGSAMLAATVAIVTGGGFAALGYAMRIKDRPTTAPPVVGRAFRVVGIAVGPYMLLTGLMNVTEAITAKDSALLFVNEMGPAPARLLLGVGGGFCIAIGGLWLLRGLRSLKGNLR